MKKVENLPRSNFTNPTYFHKNIISTAATNFTIILILHLPIFHKYLSPKKKRKTRRKMVETEKEKIICLNCRAYSDHSTGCCPYKKCQLCGKDGHLKIDCLKLQEVNKDWLSHLITYNATIDLPEDTVTFDDSKHKEWKELTNDYLLMPPRLHLNY